jgi:phytoene synthase
MLPRWTDPATADLIACRDLLCEGSRSFQAASKLLPADVRDPAIALYAFCRVADDAIDENPDGASAGLAWLRGRLAKAYEGQPEETPPDRAFARIAAQYSIPRALPEALLDGFAWDAEGRRYADLSAVRAYAVRVAGTVGAMMAVLMGVRDQGRLAAAVDLGVAMQLSNIARDVGEDARNGRLYLPLDWLAEAGIDADAFLASPNHSPELAGVIARLLGAAEEHYNRARAGIGRLPFGCRIGIGAAALLYREIGREVSRRGHDSVTGRAVVSGRRKLRVLTGGILPTALSRTRLPDAAIPEGAFLVESVLRTSPTMRRQRPAWWQVRSRVLTVLDLFERLEHRERPSTLTEA